MGPPRRFMEPVVQAVPVPVRIDNGPNAQSSTATWRLLSLTAFDGPENMAIDEALLTTVGDGTSPPTLRFYTWRSPWVSLGTGQPASDLDLSALNDRGWGILRRSSGGTAVLHEDQMGYALALPASHPLWEGDLATSYRRLAEPLARAFARLGVNAEPAPPSLKAAFAAGAPLLAGRICFSALGPYELLDCHRRKLIGNAQVRRRTCAIQHGTVQVSGTQSGLVEILAGATAAERSRVTEYLSTHVGSVEESARRCIAAEEVAGAIAEALAESLAIQLVTGALSETERCLADRLATTKYRDPGWTHRR